MKPIIEVQGRSRSCVALLGVSVLPLHASLSACNRNMFFASVHERNAETFPTLPCKDLRESMGHKAELFADDIMLKNYKTVRFALIPRLKHVGFPAHIVSA
jgi:hypothetical protein